MEFTPRRFLLSPLQKCSAARTFGAFLPDFRPSGPPGGRFFASRLFRCFLDAAREQRLTEVSGQLFQECSNPIHAWTRSSTVARKIGRAANFQLEGVNSDGRLSMTGYDRPAGIRIIQRNLESGFSCNARRLGT